MSKPYYLAIALLGIIVTTGLVTSFTSAAEKTTTGDRLFRGGPSTEQREEMKVKHEAVRAALEANDYQAWVVAIAGSPLADKADEGTFAKLVAAQQLMQAGDRDGAKAIMDELGIRSPHGPGDQGADGRAYQKGFTDGQASCANVAS